jgi:hypothetical protein
MTPSAFVVTEADFQAGFTLNDITGASSTMDENRYNCATPEAAARLLTHLNSIGLHPTPSMDFPQPGWSGDGPFAQLGPGDGKVPYLDFAMGDGSTIHGNVGGILSTLLGMNNNLRLFDWLCVNSAGWYQGAA